MDHSMSVKFPYQLADLNACLFSFLFREAAQQQLYLFSFYKLHYYNSVLYVYKKNRGRRHSSFFRFMHQLRLMHGPVTSDFHVQLRLPIFFGKPRFKNNFSAMPLCEEEARFGSFLEQFLRSYFIHGASTFSMRHLNLTKLSSMGVTSPCV